MKGLKAEIRVELRVLRPRGLSKTMELAQRVEEKNQKEKRIRSKTWGENYRCSTTTLAPRTQMVSFQRDMPKEKNIGTRQGRNLKRLMEAEVQDRRAKWLCFRCDERYAPGHRCKERTLRVLMVCDEEGEERGDVQQIEEEIYHLHLDVAEVSLNSVVGFTLNHTMKVRGQIGEQPVVVLIDSGATHNFISNRMVDRLGLKLVEKGLGVMMGTRQVKKIRGICRGVKMTL